MSAPKARISPWSFPAGQGVARQTKARILAWLGGSASDFLRLADELAGMVRK